MKLDIDCVRDVMLELESFPMGSYNVENFSKSIQTHSREKVIYALAKLCEGNYIKAHIDMVESGHYYCGPIYGLSLSGHEFLESIREPSVWQKLSGAVINGSTGSFKIIADIAIELLKKAAFSKLGLD